MIRGNSGSAAGQAHLVRRLPQLPPQLARIIAQVDHKQRSDARHSTHFYIIAAGQAVCHGLDQREPNRLVT
jgi:hypothetical protein